MINSACIFQGLYLQCSEYNLESICIGDIDLSTFRISIRAVSEMQGLSDEF